MSQEPLAQRPARPLHGHDLPVVMVDGIHSGERVILLARPRMIDGGKALRKAIVGAFGAMH